MADKRLLISMAHPDDETFTMAGSIAKYVDQGVEVELICATNGDAGVADERFLAHHNGSMKALRLAELQCAAETLGIHKTHAWGYRDSGMAGTDANNHPDSLCQADFETLVGRVVEVIRNFQPQVIVTFDPFGGYGHPDHIRMHDATMQAVQLASDDAAYPEQLTNGTDVYAPQKVYYAAFDQTVLKLFLPIMPLFGDDPERYGKNKDMNLREIAANAVDITTRVSVKGYETQAQQARECHASQLANFSSDDARNSFMNRVRRWLTQNGKDTYRRVIPPMNDSSERDLFAGVEA